MAEQRRPIKEDFRRMQAVLELVAAYDLGAEMNDFSHFIDISREHAAEEDEVEMLRSAVQFAWLLLHRLEARGVVDKDDTLQWFGVKFAERGVEER